MERIDIVQHVHVSLSVILDRELPEFSGELRLFEDLELNSLRFLEFLTSLEDTLGLDVDPDSLEPDTFRSVDSLVDYIESRLGQTDGETVVRPGQQ